MMMFAEHDDVIVDPRLNPHPHPHRTKHRQRGTNQQTHIATHLVVPSSHIIINIVIIIQNICHTNKRNYLSESRSEIGSECKSKRLMRMMNKCKQGLDLVHSPLLSGNLCGYNEEKKNSWLHNWPL